MSQRISIGAFCHTPAAAKPLAAVVVLALAVVPGALPSHGGVRDQSPTWSPDGQRLAFTTNPGGGGRIWIANLDGTGHRPFAGPTATQPAWSPDGARIAYSELRGNWDIAVKELDGGAVTKVTTDPKPDWAPAWSPDGSRIAFYRFDQAAQRGSIWVASADGSGEQVLATVGNNGMPQWSPDGTRIVFQSERDGNWEIYVMQADGSAQRRLTVTPDRHEGEPAWSPDGRIVFSAGVGDVRDIYVIDADGSNERRLTRMGRPLWAPRVSPDGSRLAFFEFLPGRLWLANADGSQPVRPFEQLSVASFTTAPERPIAGRRFTAVLRLAGPAAGAKISCQAILGVRQLRAAQRAVSGGSARCGWNLPRSAAGRPLHVVVEVSGDTGRVKRTFAGRVR